VDKYTKIGGQIIIYCLETFIEHSIIKKRGDREVNEKARENSIRPYGNSVLKSRRIGRIKGELTRNQRIAYNVFLKTAYELLLQDSDQNVFRIGLREFLDLAGFNYKNYYSWLFKDTEKQKSLKTILKELQTKTYELEWRNQKNEPYKVLSASLLSQFIMNEDKDYIEFEFPSFIRESILTHQNFYILYLPVIVSMKSSYSIALYEQILQRKEFDVWYVNREDFRGLMGVGEGEYTRAIDFERRVIKPAVREINEIVGISLTYKKVKKRKRIIAYEFHWNFNKAKEKLQEEIPYREKIDELRAIVPDLSVSILRNALNQFTFEEVKNAVLVIAERRKETHIDNPNGYLLSILKNGANKDLLSKEKEREEREKEIEQMKKLQEEKEKFEANWWDERVREELQKMDDKEKEEIWQEVKAMTHGLVGEAVMEDLFVNKVKAKLESQGVHPPTFPKKE
jgi:plasmid replication initiation protein